MTKAEISKRLKQAVDEVASLCVDLECAEDDPIETVDAAEELCDAYQGEDGLPWPVVESLLRGLLFPFAPVQSVIEAEIDKALDTWPDENATLADIWTSVWAAAFRKLAGPVVDGCAHAVETWMRGDGHADKLRAELLDALAEAIGSALEMYSFTHEDRDAVDTSTLALQLWQSRTDDDVSASAALP